MAATSKMSELHLAIQKGDERKTRELLSQKNVNEDVKDENGWTPLHYASGCNHVNIARMLKKASVNMQVNNGFTPINLACQRGHFLVDMLSFWETRKRRKSKSRTIRGLLLFILHAWEVL